MDPLTDVLAVSGVTGALSNRLEAGGRWAIVLEDYPGAALHAVTAGRVWLTIEGREPVELGAGDVVLLPADTRHGLGDLPGDASGIEGRHCDHAVARGRGTGEVLRFGSSPATTRIVTIHYDCRPAALTQVLTTLPDLVHVRAEMAPSGLDDTVRMLARELADPQITVRGGPQKPSRPRPGADAARLAGHETPGVPRNLARRAARPARRKSP